MRIKAPEKVSLVRMSLGNLRNYMDDIMKWVNDPEITFYFSGMKKKHTRTEEFEYYGKLLASGSDLIYSIVDKSGKYVGQISINKMDWFGGTGRLFLVITKEQQGKGHFYSAVKAAQDMAFKDIGLNKLWIIIRYENEMESKYRKCGFELEGVLKEEYRVGDKRFDMIRMAILKKDYEKWWGE